MSTRATYQFTPTDHRFSPTTTIYIHHDGYPEGAAVYFWNAWLNSSKGNLATQFIRANDQAELTQDHECHGDTEYRYTVTGNSWATATVEVYARQYDKVLLTDPKWRLFYSGKLSDFLEQNARMLENFTPFKTVQIFNYSGPSILNEALAEKELKREYSAYHNLVVWSKHKVVDRESSNWKNSDAEVRKLIGAFPKLVDQIDQSVIKLKVKESV